MTLLRAVRDDLVEKRLWPVALALLVALLAVPVLLGRSGAPVPPPPPAAGPPPAGAAAGTTASSGAGAATRRAARSAPVRGRFKDPFRAKGRTREGKGATTAPAGSAVTVTPDPTPPPPPPASSPLPAGGRATVPAPSGAAPAAVAPAPAPAPPSRREPATAHAAGHRVDLAWGPAAAPRRRQAVRRLTVLEADGDPEVVLMGVRPDGETALFLIVADAVADGDGRCRPTAGLCHLVELRANETEYLDVVTDDGIRQYELRVDRVSARRARTAAAAARLRADHSAEGRRLVRATIRGGRTFVRRYVYSEARGVLAFAEGDLRAGRAE